MKIVSLVSGRTALRFLPMLLVLTNALPCLHAQDFDEYKVVRIFGFWLYSNPGGSFTDATTGDVIDIKKDFNFGSYSTFTGKVDWKFTRKSHFYVAGGSFSQSRWLRCGGQLSSRGRRLTSGR